LRLLQLPHQRFREWARQSGANERGVGAAGQGNSGLGATTPAGEWQV